MKERKEREKRDAKLCKTPKIEVNTVVCYQALVPSNESNYQQKNHSPKETPTERHGEEWDERKN